MSETTFVRGSWRDVPGPKAPPLLGWRGNMFRCFGNPVDFMLRNYLKLGRLFCLAPGGNPPLFHDCETPVASFFALGPESTRELMEQAESLRTREPRGANTPANKRLAANILFTNGDRHKHQRRMLMPSLSRSAFKEHYDNIVGISRRLLDTWQGRGSFDLDREMGDLALFTGSKVFWGIDMTRDRRGLGQMMGEMVDLIFSPGARIPIDLPFFPYRRLIRLTDEIVAELQAEVDRKKAEGGGSDILSMLVRLHQQDPAQVTEDELIGQAFTIFFAGHDTTAKALAWILFLIAQHPEIAAALDEELKRELGGEPPSLDRVFDLPVLDRVVKESLRVLSPAVIFGREVVHPVVINGYELPPQAEIFYSPYVVHHDPAIYPSPRRFDPDRWLTFSPNKYEYLPFGVGPRTCLGANFASFQLRIVVAMICQRYRLEIVPGTRIDLKTTVVIGPKPALPVRVHSQDREFGRSCAPVRGYINEMVELPRR